MADLRLAKVLRVYRDRFPCADIAMLDNGDRLPRVRMMVDAPVSDAGDLALASPDPVSEPAGAAPAAGRIGTAVVGMVSDAPIIIGFLAPVNTQLLFADRAMRRWPSDVYETVDDSGNYELHHPSGASVVIGESADHVDLSGKDLKGLFALQRNTGRKVYFAINGAGGARVVMDPQGNVTVESAQTLALKGKQVHIEGDNAIVLSSPQVIIEGALTTTGAIVSNADVRVGAVTLTTLQVTGVMPGPGTSLIPVGGGPLAVSLGNFGNPKAPRGLRNNNPGNLRSGAWKGVTGSDGQYLIFATPFDGLRACALNLYHQQTLHGLNTVRGIITKYAPAADGNNTVAYIADVSRRLGVNPDASLDMANFATLKQFTAAVVAHENGSQPYDDATLSAAVGAALGS